MTDPLVVRPIADIPILIRPLATGAPEVVAIENIPGPPGAITLAVTTMAITVDAQGGVILPGVKDDLPVPFNGTIVGWQILGDLAGDMEVDILVGRPLDVPAVPYASIVGGNPPELVATAVMQGDATGWASALSEGDVVRYTIVSNSLVRRATIALFVERD